MTLARTPASLTPGLLSILLRLTTEIEWRKLPLSMIGTDGNIQHHPFHHGQTEHRTGKFFFISTGEPSHTTMFFCSHPRQGHGRPPMSHSHLHQHRPQMFQNRHAYSRDEPNQAASQGGRPPPLLSSQRPFDPSHRQPNQQPTPLHTQAQTHHPTHTSQAGHPPSLPYNSDLSSQHPPVPRSKSSFGKPPLSLNGRSLTIHAMSSHTHNPQRNNL